MSVTKSLQRQRRDQRKRRREEQRWARRSGPIEVRFVCPICRGPHARSAHPEARS